MVHCCSNKKRLDAKFPVNQQFQFQRTNNYGQAALLRKQCQYKATYKDRRAHPPIHGLVSGSTFLPIYA